MQGVYKNYTQIQMPLSFTQFWRILISLAQLLLRFALIFFWNWSATFEVIKFSVKISKSVPLILALFN